MAEIIFQPSSHRCHDELKGLGHRPVGTVARCSCGKKYVVRDQQWAAGFWTELPMEVPGALEN